MAKKGPKSSQLSLANAEQVRKQETIKLQRDIRKMYEELADEIQTEINKLSRKNSASALIQMRELKSLQKKINKECNLITRMIQRKCTQTAFKIAGAVVEDNRTWLKKSGIFTRNAFLDVPKQTVNLLMSGKIYNRKNFLSRRIWQYNNNIIKNINKIVAKGLAGNKPMVDIAKDLEKYVRPSAAKKSKTIKWTDANGKAQRYYPGQIDYNAQRLARTMSQHSYEQSFKQCTEKNPWVEAYVWIANGSRVCNICEDRANTDYFGLGPGVYPKNELPLDHPNGMCVFVPYIPDPLEKIADDVTDWMNAPSGTYPDMDEFILSLVN